jgi:hypothetical protein
VSPPLPRILRKHRAEKQTQGKYTNVGFIRMKDWDEWQSYRSDRGAPPWIKVHRNLLSNQKWAALSDEEKGQLISMWVVAADNNGAIPDEPRVVRKICQLDSEPNIKRFIDLGWVVPVGGQLDAMVTPEVCQVDAPETEKRQSRDRVEKKQKETECVEFDEFWKSYPYKVGKPAALKAWLAKNPPLNEVIEGVGRWKACKAWKKNGGEYIPHPSTFINQERWKDVPEPEKAQRPQGESPFFIPYGG